MKIEVTKKCSNCGAECARTEVKCPECGAFFGETAISRSVDIFHSEYRSPANSGYTQQQQQQNPIQYTGESTQQNVYDDMFIHRSSKVIPENLMQDTPPEEHDAELNPYDNMPADAPINENAHTEEFVAKNIFEFRKHMFGRVYANKILFYSLGLVLADAVSVFFDILLDASHLSNPVVLVYTFFLIVLLIISNRKFHRGASNTIAFLTIIYSIIMLVLMNLIHTKATAAELYFIYVPISAMDFLCLKLTLAMARYHETWEMYQQKLLRKKKKSKSIDEISEDSK